jgi:acyl-CoA dehydrogenase
MLPIRGREEQMETYPLYGYLAESMATGSLSMVTMVVWICLFLGIGYLGSSLLVWTLFILGSMWLYGFSLGAIGIFGVLLILFNIKALRTILVSGPLMNIMKKLEFIPKISETERTALEAGVVWVEGDLFSGKPDFK